MCTWGPPCLYLPCKPFSKTWCLLLFAHYSFSVVAVKDYHHFSRGRSKLCITVPLISTIPPVPMYPHWFMAYKTSAPLSQREQPERQLQSSLSPPNFLIMKEWLEWLSPFFSHSSDLPAKSFQTPLLQLFSVGNTGSALELTACLQEAGLKTGLSLHSSGGLEQTLSVAPYRWLSFCRIGVC